MIIPATDKSWGLDFWMISANANWLLVKHKPSFVDVGLGGWQREVGISFCSGLICPFGYCRMFRLSEAGCIAWLVIVDVLKR